MPKFLEIALSILDTGIDKKILMKSFYNFA